jgi:hypothetical protein
MRPSTENLIWAIDQVHNAYIEKRSDVSAELLTKILRIKDELQYIRETQTE